MLPSPETNIAPEFGMVRFLRDMLVLGRGEVLCFFGGGKNDKKHGIILKQFDRELGVPFWQPWCFRYELF